MNQTDVMKLLLDDRRLFKETLMRIETKERELVPFTLNPIQADMNDTFTGKDVVVKPAQVGFTSDIVCDFLIDCVTVPGTTSVIISYDEFITGRLLRKARAFYNTLRESIPTLDKLHHKSASELTFEKLRSSFYISSSRSFTGVRGEMIHNLLLDEFAFWQPGDAERVMAAAMQRVPLNAKTKVIIGSTPNGEDNAFFETYYAAKEGKHIGKSVFTHHFYPWYIHPEYFLLHTNIIALPGDEIPVLKNIDVEEEALIKRWTGMDFDEETCHNKLRWRRYKVAEMSSLRRTGETRMLFKQEYPEDDLSCFLSAGDMVYDHLMINDKARDCYPAQLHHLDADIWFPPEEGVKYLVAIDPGVGITSESVATVWSFTELEFRHHATLSGFYKGDEMGEKSIILAQYFNNAVIAAEDALEFVGYIKRYPNLYYRTDVVSGKISNHIGWQTSPKNKQYMVTEVNRHFSKIKTHDIRIISQCRNLRWIVGARGERAVAVGMDDYHDSLAIAVVTRESLPIERGFVGTSGWSDSWGR